MPPEVSAAGVLERRHPTPETKRPMWYIRGRRTQGSFGRFSSRLYGAPHQYFPVSQYLPGDPPTDLAARLQTSEMTLRRSLNRVEVVCDLVRSVNARPTPPKLQMLWSHGPSGGSRLPRVGMWSEPPEQEPLTSSRGGASGVRSPPPPLGAECR